MDKTDNRDKKILRAQRETSEFMHKQDEGFRHYSNLDFVLTIALALIITLSVRLFIFEPIRVDGESMIDTLHDGERMFVNKMSYWFDEPEFGQIIICFYPDRTETCVKRVVGLPGDVLEIKDGYLYRNGTRADEDAYYPYEMMYLMEPVTVPEDCVFVMGDNRNGSLDSRSSSVGPIPYCRIVGRVKSVIWPISAARDIV